MKKVINKKMYNTETAECLATFDNGLNKSDFNWIAESLFKTKNGAYFLHGEGGPLTEYSEECGSNSWTGSDEITPLTRDEAVEWAERRNQIGLFADEFADEIDEA